MPPPTEARRTHVPPVPVPPPAEDFQDEDIASLDPDRLAAAAHPLPPIPPEDLAEQLFHRGVEIARAPDIAAAAQTTLDIIEQYIPSLASSVLYASINDTALRFLAARGPRATELEDVTVELGTGIAGFSFDTGGVLIIRDARTDPRHRHDVDIQTTFDAETILSIALRDTEGGIHGCIHIINPAVDFDDQHLEIVSTLSLTLADTLRVRA